MIVSGFLYSLGGFDLLPLYSVLVAGNFIADIGWYTLGRFGTRNFIFKYGYFVGITPERLQKVEKYFNLYHQKILIITKLTTGFGLAIIVLIVAGIFKVPFKNYLILTLFGGFVWAAFLLTIGYFFGNIFNVIPGSLKVFFAILIVAIFVLGIKYVNKYMQEKTI
jgi:membrane protein DedA with SNARE-associated domain